MKTALIIGFGSIGKRHARVLEKLSYTPVLVTKQQIDMYTTYQDVTEAIQMEHPAYIVIANETSKHKSSLEQIVAAGYNGKLLIEKPLFANWTEGLDTRQLSSVYVGYNLRFHPLLLKLKQVLENRTILNMQIYVGQHLTTWRANSDYRSSYSSSKELGGGVLRDLSHELDYALWLSGACERVAAIGGTFSSLDIDTDDIYSILMKFKSGATATIQLNYLDRIKQREMIIHTEEATIRVDFIKGLLQMNDDMETISCESDTSYLLQHQAILNGNEEHACDFKQGLEVMRLVAAIENSSEKKVWSYL